MRILNLLRKGELCVCEIEVLLKTNQSNVSRHLSKLKTAGIVTYEKKAQWIHYRLSSTFVEENKQLYLYIVDSMEVRDPFVTDLQRLGKYKESNASCENIKEMSNLIFTGCGIEKN